MTVIDASAVVDLLIPRDDRPRDLLLAEVPEPASPWLAPDILIFEVFSVVRRHLLRRVLPARAATQALQRLPGLPIELVPAASLLPAAWSLRERFSAADSLYTALALRSEEPLLTTDLRLARAAREVGVETRPGGM